MGNNLIAELIKAIWTYMAEVKEIKIMEVCGTHTQSIAKYGISSVLPPGIKLLSGPGCPVCVAPASFIDDAVRLMMMDNVIVATFGDMVRVKGTETSLDNSRTKDKKPAVVYSPLEALEIAENNRDRTVVFLAVGFETTAPAIAAMIRHAEEKSIHNINVLTSIRLMPPILEIVLEKHDGELGGMICPGHVATVMGEEYFRFLPDKHDICSVISGFDAADILGAIYLIVQSKCGDKKPELKNIYKRCVSFNGNEKAKSLMGEVFAASKGLWRGIGLVGDSALVLKERYMKYDAVYNFNLSPRDHEAAMECSCGDILMGKRSPGECRLFDSACSPANPYGPCMVSTEGSCSVYYRYRR